MCKGPFILEKIEVLVGCIGKQAPFPLPLRTAPIQLRVGFYPACPVPKRKRERDFPFDERHRCHRRRILCDGKGTIRVLKPIRQLNVAPACLIPRGAKGLVQALSGLLAQLCQLNEQWKQGNQDITLFLPAHLCGSSRRSALGVAVEKPCWKWG